MQDKKTADVKALLEELSSKNLSPEQRKKVAKILREALIRNAYHHPEQRKDLLFHLTKKPTS